MPKTNSEIAKGLLGIAQQIYIEQWEPGDIHSMTVAPQIFVRMDEEDDLEGIDPRIVGPFFTSPGMKHALAQAIHALLHKGYEGRIPSAVFVVTEALLRSGKGVTQYPTDEEMEKITPEEVLMIQTHTREGTQVAVQRVKEGKLLGNSDDDPMFETARATGGPMSMDELNAREKPPH